MTQVSSFIDILKGLGITKDSAYKRGLVELLQEEFPTISADVTNWDMDLTSAQEEEGGAF